MGKIDHYEIRYRYTGVKRDEVLETKMQEITLPELKNGCMYSLTVQSVTDKTSSNKSSPSQLEVIEFITGMNFRYVRGSPLD